MTTPDRLADEQTLVGRLKKGDEQAVVGLMNRYGSELLHYLVAILGSREWAEDVFQDSWVKVMQKIGNFRANSAFAPWLFRIARNGAYDLLRQKQRRLTLEKPGEEEVNLPVKPRASVNWAEDLAQKELVQKMLSALEPMYREVVWLRFFEDMSYEEICLHTGLPMGTVKSRLFRALDQVATIYRQLKENC